MNMIEAFQKQHDGGSVEGSLYSVLLFVHLQSHLDHTQQRIINVFVKS